MIPLVNRYACVCFRKKWEMIVMTSVLVGDHDMETNGENTESSQIQSSEKQMQSIASLYYFKRISDNIESKKRLWCVSSLCVCSVVSTILILMKHSTFNLF